MEDDRDNPDMDDENQPLAQSNSSDEDKTKFPQVEWDETRMVWDLAELEEINKQR